VDWIFKQVLRVVGWTATVAVFTAMLAVFWRVAKATWEFVMGL
jgi:hypothetical protein